MSLSLRHFGFSADFENSPVFFIFCVLLRFPCSWMCWSVSAQMWLRTSLLVRNELAAVLLLGLRGRQWDKAGKSSGGSWEELPSLWVGNQSSSFTLKTTRCSHRHIFFYIYLCVTLIGSDVALKYGRYVISSALVSLFPQRTSQTVAMTTSLCPESNTWKDWARIAQMEMFCLTSRWHFLFLSVTHVLFVSMTLQQSLHLSAESWWGQHRSQHYQ